MNAFEQAGLARVMAEAHKAQLARAMMAGLKNWFAGVAKWLDDMPTTLPPTESVRR